MLFVFCFFFYHKWMTSHNFFDFGVTCSTFISLCPNIRNTGLYFYLVFDFLNFGKMEKMSFHKDQNSFQM